MQRSKFKKVAIIAGLSECLVYAEAKYCAFEIHGEPKYYVCPKTEYCCNFGCCVSPGFQIYHLWYYWLLVIIMFLVCSGGGWWYRFWLQGRYRAAASTIPTSRSPNVRRQSSTHQRPSTCQGQQASISYNAVRNTVLLHRMWKTPHQRSQLPLTYAGNGAASSAHYQNTNVVLNDINCPYYQLYGPPPSYETVISQTRGKNFETPSNLLSPERSIDRRNDGHSHCYSHNNHSTLVNPDTHIGQIQLDNNCPAATYFSAQPDNYNNCHHYRHNGDGIYNFVTPNNNQEQRVITHECPSQQISGNSLIASGQHAVSITTAIPSPINPSDNVILEKLDNYSTTTTNTITTTTNTITTTSNDTQRNYDIDNQNQSTSRGYTGFSTQFNRRTSNDEDRNLHSIIESNKQKKLDRSKSLD